MTEILNDADFYKEYEIIGGEKFMAPVANLDHSNIISRIHFCFVKYFLGHKSGYVFCDDVDVHFSDGTLFKPDLCVVLKSNEKILASRKAIYGAPDIEEAEWLQSKGEAVEVKQEIPVSIAEGLTIPIEFIFSWGY